MHTIDADSIEPLLSLAAPAEPQMRLAVLQAAGRFPLEPEAWRRLANLTYELVQSEPAGSDVRRAALGLAVRIPLRSLREHLRGLAGDPGEPDRDVIATAMQEVRDPSCLGPALAAASGDFGAFAILAALPLEEEGVRAAEIPPVPSDSPPSAGFWRALALARVGEYGELDAVFEGQVPAPEFFWGSPWSAYAEIAQVRPIPGAMREHLLGLLAECQEQPNERLIQLTVWAATGIADAEGNPIAVEPPESAAPPRRSNVATPGTGAESPDALARRIVALVKDGNRRAAALASGAWANVEIGNQIIESVPFVAPPDSWPVAELATEQLRAARAALDDEQMGWLLARDDPARVIRELAGLLAGTADPRDRSRLLGLLATVADRIAGRAGSPYRGAGGGPPPPDGRTPLIDDEPHAAAIAPPAPDDGGRGLEAEPPELDREPQEEKRRVHARVLFDGRPRNTFVTGRENLIRCWIGLPEDAPMADQPIPQTDIPPEGLPLKAVLSWGSQTDTKPLLLPAARDARSGDCDLRFKVPDGEFAVSVDIAFLYRGRVFEVVQVQALAVAPGEPDPPNREVKVRVQVSRREVIDLRERIEFDAAMTWGADDAETGHAPEAPAASPNLRVFGARGGGHFDLRDTETAINWVNQNLFTAEKSLVRRRGTQGAADARPRLDADDLEVRRLLRDMARHGAELFNQLALQGFRDPGPRIQLLNREPTAYVPLEFVYDQGYPADDARLCDGWESALLADEDGCPVCSAAPLTREQRSWTPTICPLGFWSLKKIIERLDPEPGAHFAAPSSQRRALPAITRTLFASSHKVPPEGRESLWQALTENLDEPERAENWEEWRLALRRHPQLLLVLPHHDLEAALDYLEIGNEQLPPQMRRLSRGQLTEIYVNPDGVDPGPIVLLLGCRTGTATEVGYVGLARRFQQLRTSIVVGTLAQILGRHAAPVAGELVSQLLAVDDPEADFGTIMRRVRRRMLANGYLMSLCLVALGDAEWRLTPRPGASESEGGPAHVSP